MTLSASFLVLGLAIIPLVTSLTVTVLELKPHGIRFTIQDEPGISLIGLHYSINNPLVGVAGGQYNYDIRTRGTGGSWVHENQQVSVSPGDKVYYWVYETVNGQPVQLLNQAWTVPLPTTTTTSTRAPPPTTRKPSTQAPPMTTRHWNNNQVNSGGNNNHPSNNNQNHVYNNNRTSSQTSGSQTLTSSGSGSGSGCCNCNCSAAPVPGAQTMAPGKPGSQCTSYPCLIFEDEFDFLNLDVWEHEITASGGGNWEFQYYTNNRTNSYVKNGTLYIKPLWLYLGNSQVSVYRAIGPLVLGEKPNSKKISPLPETYTNVRPAYLKAKSEPPVLEIPPTVSDRRSTVIHKELSLTNNGSQPGDVCTANLDYGCRRMGTATNIINPIQSARLRSARGFSFKYGKVEIEAKMPTGDWLWPAIWLLPLRNAYGRWPASGEIDIVEARGNRHYTDDKGQEQGIKNAGSTLHFGSDFWHNKWPKAHGEKLASSGNYGDSFHKYELVWDENHISISIDGDEVLNVTPPKTMWEFGELDKDGKIDNPWQAGTKMAPFDQEFFLIMNVAVGGTAFFPDKNHNSPPKPWNDKSKTAAHEFWNAKAQWLPTWHQSTNNGEDAAMQVKYIRVYKLKP